MENDEANAPISMQLQCDCRSTLRWLILFSLDLMARNTPSPDETITDASGDHQLLVRWTPFGDGFNFDSLVWQHRRGDSWKEHAVITREQFEKGTPHHRWVSTVHSFDPVEGTAIVRVAEGDAPRGADHAHYAYSWREWDLLRNREVRFIRSCSTPHEKFERD